MRLLTVLLCTCLLAACGWQWRGTAATMVFDELALRGGEARTRYDIEAALLQREVMVSESAPVILQIDSERWSKRTVVVDRQGRSAGVEMRYEIVWQLRDPSGPPLSARRELFLTRTYQVDPTNALATSDEESLTREMMRREAAEGLMQQLHAESVRLTPAAAVEP
ncbi:MAG: LPS assembly lipoprotein LptE [Alcanivoracaceae bacterium]